MMLLSESVLHVKMVMADRSDAKSPLTPEGRLHAAVDEAMCREVSWILIKDRMDHGLTQGLRLNRYSQGNAPVVGCIRHLL